MFERFTGSARLAVVAAQEQARTRGSDRIRTEHLLLALYTVPDDLAVAILDTLEVDRDSMRRAVDEHQAGGPASDAAALATLGIDLDEVRRRVELAFGPGALDRTRAAGGRGSRFGGHLPFEPAAKKALELALREALHLEHDYIGTEHLLLGLLHSEGLAGEILTGHGMRLDATRALVAQLVRRRRAG